jgi:RimK family alpha-L-glutamate ligase
MKKILVVGINEKIHTTARLIEEARKKKIALTFIRWGSLFFKNNEAFAKDKKIHWATFKSAFFDVPSFYVNPKGQKRKRIAFDLDNDLNILLNTLCEKNISSANRDFMLKYPYYNKFTQSQIFSSSNIPAIPTLHLADNKLDKVLGALRIAKFKFPLVVKESDGGLGENVWKLNNKKELEAFVEIRRNMNLIYQPFMKNDGDFRVLVIRGKSMGIMKRKAKGKEWRNNFALGGIIEKYEDKKMERFAETVAKKMSLDYAGIDIFKFSEGYRVIEVNIFARFEGFEKTYPKINIAEEILKFLK